MPSAQRLQAYREVTGLVGFSCQVEDSEEEDDQGGVHGGGKPPKLISPSQTRWLVMVDCMEKILCHYNALKAHFELE